MNRRIRKNQPKIARSTIASVIEAVLETGAKRATKYVSDRCVVKATRKTYGSQGHKIDLRETDVSVVLNIGAPNYSEHKAIKKMKRDGVKFPVRHLVLKFPRVTKAAKKRRSRKK